jgi:rare lipoprotein A
MHVARAPQHRANVLEATLLTALCFSAGCALVSRLPGIGGLAARGPAVGTASFYGKEHQGKRTASGEPFDPYALTAAHPSLPFGTRLRVTNLENGRSVVVRVNDRGPYLSGRIVDLSLAAARALGASGSGVVRVRIQPLR